MKICIKNAHVLIQNKKLEKVDLLLDQGKILEINPMISEQDCMIINGENLTVLPGLIDVHVHLRDPGYQEKETIETGTKAAAKGGFTTIFAMPNVIPYPDCEEVMSEYIHALKQGIVNVYPYACITMQEQGKRLVDIKTLKEQFQITAFSDDGVGVQNEKLMEQALELSNSNGIIIAAHAEDMSYRKTGACMHEGIQNKKLGYVGIPSACESEQILRDLKLVEKTNGIYHACHVSTKESVEYLRKYKAKGLNITAEVTAHHLLLNEEDVKDDANFKMNPPLRSKKDQNALWEGLMDGTIDFIASDHAPHTCEEKNRGMIKAPFGIVALETAFSLLYTEFVDTHKISLHQLIYWMSEAAAKRFHLEKKGMIDIGYDADLILVNLEESFSISSSEFESKGRNTPFEGWECKGVVYYTIVNGTIVYKKGEQ